MARRKRLAATSKKEKHEQPLKKAKQSTKPSSTKSNEKSISKNLRSLTNKKTIQKDKVKIGQNTLNMRCYPTKFLKIVQKLELQERHMKAMNRTPFGHFLKMPNLLCERTILEESCGVWEKGRKGFKLGNSIIPFKVSDCALILGLSSHGDIVDFEKHGECTEFQKRFFDKSLPTTNVIVRHLQRLMYEELGPLEDFTKMMVLLLFSTVLFPQTNFSLPIQLLSYVDEIERLQDYAWADAVHRFLIKHIPDASDRVRRKKRGESQTAGYINGCAILINVFVFEHSNIVKPKSIARDKVPRLFKWESIKHHRKNSAANLIEGMKDFQVIERLVPRDVENRFLSKKATQDQKKESNKDSLESIKAERDRLFEENVRLMKENDRLTGENSRLTTEIHMWMKSFHNAQSGMKWDEDEDEDDSNGYSMSSSKQDKFVEKDEDVGQIDKKNSTLDEQTHTVKDESKEKGKGLRDKKKSSKITSPFLLFSSPKKKGNKTIPMDDLNELERNLIANFLNLDMDGTIVFENEDTFCTRKQIFELLTRRCLEGDVINVCGHIFQEQSRTEDGELRTIYVSSLFHHWFLNGETKKAENHLSALREMISTTIGLVFIPLLTNFHWHLLVINMKKGCFDAYTSKKGKMYMKSAEAIVAHIKNNYKEIVDEGWQLNDCVTCPKQTNGTDCGVFVLKYMECLGQAKEFEFTHVDMDNFRGKLASLILQKSQTLISKAMGSES
ncbi:hypothetical protein QJS10_CPA08g01048 [Acorus calamus]|nr:hypothetical protein QJS10_CPA08g01048 [Acorus calamus]